MSLTNSNIQRYFKIFGKLIKLAVEGDSIAQQYRTLLSATVDQSVSGVASEYSTIISVLNPLSTSLAAAIATADGVYATSVKYVGLMLQQVCAVDLGLQPGAAIVLVGPALIAAMNAVSETVATASGDTTENDTASIAQFFIDNFGITLPQSGSPTISDSFITATVL